MQSRHIKIVLEFRPQGLEPRFSESESDVLPLHHGRTVGARKD